MATKKTAKKAPKKRAKKATSSSSTTGNPKFPYATVPNSLRRFLELVPTKPRPPKINKETLRAWGLRSSNDVSIIRVLKALGLVGSNNEPTNTYTEFMMPGTGPAVLANAIRSVWAPLFEASHEPHREDDTTLLNYFNVHSGGSERTLAHQMQSFRAVCDYADFTGDIVTPGVAPVASAPDLASQSGATGTTGAATFHIDLHIHLPENKSRRDYEYIFEDIARYILGRETGSDSRDGT